MAACYTLWWFFVRIQEYVSKTDPYDIVESFDPLNPSDFIWDTPREATKYKEMRDDNYSIEENELLTYFINSIDCGLGKRWANGHVIAGYQYVITRGYKTLEEQLQRNYAVAKGDQKDYFEAMIIVVQSAQKYIGRYEEAAKQILKNDIDVSQKRSIERIARSCARIKTDTPSNFFEAVQALYLLHEMLLFENHTGSMSLGRVDQLLYPYYEKEKREGTILY
jgi:formate C-acetyltransferase